MGTANTKKFKNSEMPLEEERVKLEAKVVELDDLIKVHLDCMANLTNHSVAVKRQLNARVPFARLPIELVTMTSIWRLFCTFNPRTQLSERARNFRPARNFWMLNLTARRNFRLCKGINSSM